MKTFNPVILLYLVSALFFCNSVFCQSDTTVFENLSLKELLSVKITTASRTSLELKKVPATVMVVTKEQIKMRGYRSLLDVLYDLPDMKVDDKAYSVSRTSLVFRGIQGQEKFLLLLDGIRISTPTGDVVPIMENYPVNFAEQIEIIYGPASALYGADAVSGVINIITKKSPAKKGLYIEASSMVGTYGYTNNTLFITKKFNNRTYLIVSGQYSYDKGPDYSKLYNDDTLLSTTPNATGTFNSIYGQMTQDERVKPGYAAPMKAYNMYASLRVNDFSFSLFRNFASTPSTIENNTSNAVYNEDVFLGQYIDMVSASYRKAFNKITLSNTLSVSQNYMDPKSNYRNLYTGMARAYKYVYNSMIKAEQQVDWATRNLTVTTGIAYEKYHSIPWSTDLEDPIDPRTYIHGSYLGTKSYYRPEGLPALFYVSNYYNLGSFLQMQYSPARELSLTVGGRYDVNSRYGNNFTPRLGLVYKPVTRTIIKALYGRSFLAPNTSDFYAQWGSFVTNDSGKTYLSYWLHLPNTSLKPITSEVLELNINQLISDNLSITLDAYASKTAGLHATANDNTSTHIYNNMFNGIPVDYIEVFINQGVQKTYGGSLQLSYKKSIGKAHISSNASLSYVNGFTKTNVHGAIKNQLEFISPVMFHAGVDIRVGKFSCSPRLNVMSRQNLTGFSDTTGSVLKRQTISGYQLLNVSVKFNFTRQIAGFVNATNVLNQKYRSVGFNMDLEKKPTEFFYGQHQDPIRIYSGVNFNL